MVCTRNADIDQIQPVFRLLGETDGLRALAVLIGTLNVLSSLQSWVLCDILINRQKASKRGRIVLISVAAMVGLVDTIVPLVADDGLFEVTANMTVINEPLNVLSFIIDLLFWIEHVVALFAESHAFVLAWLAQHGFSAGCSGIGGGRLADTAGHL